MRDERNQMSASGQKERLAAIIDIGSNSVRLVVYAGPHRAPTPVFNEKLMIGLGASLASSGRIEKGPYRRALQALARFQVLTAAMGVTDVRYVATAAIRDATNGEDFIAAAQAINITIELLSGRQEAEAAGYGVISAMPDADGIVADLGGGSLELVRIKRGVVVRGTSFPLGVLRLPAMRASNGRGFIRKIGSLLAAEGWPGDDKGLPLYLVGGSWRALARFDMLLSRNPLPIVSGHCMDIASAGRLARRIAATNLANVARLPGFATARVEAMPEASALLAAMVRALKPEQLIVSASGLREGLLYQTLPKQIQAEDPLLAAASAEGRKFARFAPHGPAIDAWISPLFADDAANDRRLRLAACLMTDVAASANPDFRAERAVEIALHGNWLSISPADRLILAQTLYTASGGGNRLFDPQIVDHSGGQMRRAICWGHAIRLAQRLSGGAASPLMQSALTMDDTHITLTLSGSGAALAGDQVEKRLRQLASAMGRTMKLVKVSE